MGADKGNRVPKAASLFQIIHGLRDRLAWAAPRYLHPFTSTREVVVVLYASR